MLGHLEHRHGGLATENGFQRGIGVDLGLFLRVLELVLLDVVPDFFGELAAGKRGGTNDHREGGVGLNWLEEGRIGFPFRFGGSWHVWFFGWSFPPAAACGVGNEPSVLVGGGLELGRLLTTHPTFVQPFFTQIQAPSVRTNSPQCAENPAPNAAIQTRRVSGFIPASTAASTLGLLIFP